MPTRDPDANWIAMNEQAHRIREIGEMQHGLPPLDPTTEDFQLIDAGVALGIAAATEFYRDHPDEIPARL